MTYLRKYKGRDIEVTKRHNFWFFILGVSHVFSHTCFSLNQDSANSYLTRKDQGVYFIENKGQFLTLENLPQILYKGEVSGTSIYITEKGLTYLFSSVQKKKQDVKFLNSKESIEFLYSRFDIDLKGANIQKENIAAETPSVEDYNFFYSHCPGGVVSVKQFKKLSIKNVYPGIDWILYGSETSGLKYDFIIHPGADESKIRLLYKTLYPLTFNKDGIQIELGEFHFLEKSPITYLENSQLIKSSYDLITKEKKQNSETSYYETEIGFRVAKHDKSQTVIIDPLQLWWGTYYGGSKGSEGVSITTDSIGNVFVLGNTDSQDIPVQPYGGLAYFQGIYGGANNGGGLGDPFILKFTNGGQLLWATYFGGSNIDNGKAIKCDKIGNIFILGETCSVDFPLKNPGGGAYFDTMNGVSDWRPDFFISKFSNSGQYLWSTYYGGSDYDYPTSLDTDKQGNVYCTGYSWSTDFPLFNPGNGSYFQSGFTGGILNISDGVILKFSNAGQLLLATFYGGNGEDQLFSVVCDDFGNAYFVGHTSSPNLFLLNPGGGAYFQNTLYPAGGNPNGCILKLNNNGQAVWSTYLGGCCSDRIKSGVCDKLGNLFITGSSSSNNFPLINPGGGAYYLTNYAVSPFLCKFNSQSKLVWSTRFRGAGDQVVIGKCGEIYLSAPHTENVYDSIPILNPGNGAYCDSTYDGSYNLSLDDIFISAFSNNGVYRWGTFFGGQGSDISMTMTADKDGNLFYTGQQGSVYYTTVASYQTYAAGCIVNPANGAYFQSIPLCSTNTLLPLGFEPSCVVGKFTGPSFNSIYSTAGCGSTNSASIQTVSGWGPYTYTWSTGSHNDSIANQPQGTYSYSITDTFFGCTESKTFFLGLPSLTLNVNSTDTSICIGNSVAFSVSGANSFSWSPAQTLNSSSGSSVTASPVTTSNYTVTGYNSPTCKSDTVINVTVNPLPVIKVAGRDSVCKGSSVTLSASGAMQFSWSPANSFAFLNNDTVTVTPLSDEVYGIIGKDQNGCIDSSSFKIKVIAVPQLKIIGSNTLCAGATVTLTASGAEKLRWNKIDTLVHKDTSMIVVSPHANATYSLSGISGDLCKDSTSISITVFRLPKLFVESPDSVCPKKDFTLSAKGSGEFNWEPVNLLNCTQCSDPVAKITGSTLFYVNLIDSNTCVSKDSVLVGVKDDCFIQLIIPNIFTPNNDNSNDAFKLTGKNVSSVNCYIFSRWGKLIHSFDSMDGYWNGEESSGVNSADAVYFYVITATDTWKEEHIYKGTIQLIR